MKHRPLPPAARRRRGTAAVEVALCLPVLFAFTLGTIDLCSMLFLKESMTIAAYEGARKGIERGGTNADAVRRVLDFLDERNIEHDGAGSVQISGPGFDGAETLEHVTLSVTVPCSDNLLMPSNLYGDLSITASVTMRKEYANPDPSS